MQARTLPRISGSLVLTSSLSSKIVLSSTSFTVATWDDFFIAGACNFGVGTSAVDWFLFVIFQVITINFLKYKYRSL